MSSKIVVVSFTDDDQFSLYQILQARVTFMQVSLFVTAYLGLRRFRHA
jgi:hypothetical protein